MDLSALDRALCSKDFPLLLVVDSSSWRMYDGPWELRSDLSEDDEGEGLTRVDEPADPADPAVSAEVSRG